jgi:hypothetical protein
MNAEAASQRDFRSARDAAPAMAPHKPSGSNIANLHRSFQASLHRTGAAGATNQQHAETVFAC